MTECEIQILITNNNKHEKHKQKPDQTQNMTAFFRFRVILVLPGSHLILYLVFLLLESRLILLL